MALIYIILLGDIMKMSKMGFNSTKLPNLDEMFPAQDMLIKTNQLIMYESGIFAYDYVPYMLQKKVEAITGI